MDRPRAGGPALILVGALFAAWMLGDGRRASGALVALAIVPAPLIVAGVLFTLAGYAATGARSQG